MTAVRVEGGNERVAFAASEFQRGDRGTAESHLAGTMEAPQTGFASRRLCHPLAGAIGAVVIDHQDVGGRQHTPPPTHQVRQIFPLVVGRQRNQQLVGRQLVG